MADWAIIEAERFQDLHCKPDGITLTAGAKVNLANTLRRIADERVREARREVWNAAIRIARYYREEEGDIADQTKCSLEAARAAEKDSHVNQTK